MSEKVQKNEGLYEQAVTEAVAEAVSGLIATMEQVTDPELRADLLSELVRSELFNLLRDEDKSSGPKSINVVNSILESIGSPTRLPASPHPQLLTSILRNTLSDARKVEVRPRTPLRDLALLTNAKGEPGIGSELKAELRSADQIDILVSFIRLTGLRQVYDELKAANQRGARIRVVTSVYIGATEKKALDQLVLELGAEVKVDFEARHNRLHAKAWLFGRQSGFSTAYIGSSNMSSAAMTSGLEWNVRLSAAKSPHLLEKFSISFETYWASKDFVTYDPAVNGEQLEEALYRASGKVDNSGNEDQLSGLQINPWPYQQTMLDELQVSRDVHGHHENLVVAATGTGKTVLAAFDYKRQISTGGRYPKLLFVAHTKEILKQARRTFREVLGDASFGEMLVDGEKPKTWDHVFASIQSLKSKLTEFSRDQFEFVIVDEFHHAEAPSYKRLLGALKPRELLGLTATPERGDDKSVQDLFGGRIASELRLWDALDQELLAPFHYFGIHEDTDYSHLDWSNGSYDRTQLSQLVTGNTVRDKLVLDQINRMVLNPKTMKCLVYCVSEQHSEYIAGLFSKHGIETVSVTQSTKPEVRADAVRNLSNGRIQAISSVNVFNEGLDIPSVDTIVMLRPTESPVVFIQQLGRGLRKSPGKEEVLVLDFVGAHRAEYRLDRKLQAMTGVPRGKLPKAIEDGFPFLPSGVFISLDRLSTEQVLAGVKAQVNPPRQKLLKEIAEIGSTSLETFLELSGRELSEVYRLPGESWSSLCSAAGLTDPLELGFEVKSLLPSIKRFLHIDDPERIDHYSRFAEGRFSPWESASETENRYKNMFFWNLFPDASDPNGRKWGSVDEALTVLGETKVFSFEFLELLKILRSRIQTLSKDIKFARADLPLKAHATYTRYELVAGIGRATRPNSTFGFREKPTESLAAMLEGVVWSPNSGVDLFLSTLQKSEADYSPQTRYLDYAIAPDIFHWESQSRTDVKSVVGQRYINHVEQGTDILLAIRDAKPRADEPGSAAYKLLGLADYIRHEGSRPIKFWWQLREPMDPATFAKAAAVKVA